MTTWGIVATIKAADIDILRFVAYHLDAGADQVFIYLDQDARAARTALKTHPKCHVTLCDDDYWHTVHNARPEKHQVRQSRNASHAYANAQGLDWLMHLDVDEFLVCESEISNVLAALPAKTQTGRVRPMEALVPPKGTAVEAFKTFIPGGPERRRLVQSIYPTFGPYLKGGFISHLAGKMFTRTGHTNVRLRIHNAAQNGKVFAEEETLDQIALAHCHAQNWQHWQHMFAYRHAKGSYRAEMAPALPPEQGGMTLHMLFEYLKTGQETDGLRSFFDEVCADTPELRAKLEANGVLCLHNLYLSEKLSRHFPGI